MLPDELEIEKHYYEKFTVRYHISRIIQQIWPNQAYRDKLEQESESVLSIVTPKDPHRS
jgi:hypothetical protein